MTKPQEKTPLIALKSVYKAYGTHTVLSGFNLDVYPGEQVVLLGRSGSGKSVALKCIAGLTKVDAGTVHLMGHDITFYDEKHLNPLRKRMGFLFQNAALYDSMSVEENLAFTLRHHDPSWSNQKLAKRIKTTLENVGLASALHLMPSELSGGMRKRIGLARALIINPEVMLYDEPTAGLDTRTAQEIIDLMLRIKSEFHPTAIIITHDLQCAEQTGDRIVVLSEGKIILSGTFSELVQSSLPEVQVFFNRATR
jgi:phospholipid/cholesterol/gamma-HCH transport system ATP-binding protein